MPCHFLFFYPDGPIKTTKGYRTWQKSHRELLFIWLGFWSNANDDPFLFCVQYFHFEKSKGFFSIQVNHNFAQFARPPVPRYFKVFLKSEKAWKWYLEAILEPFAYIFPSLLPFSDLEILQFLSSLIKHSLDYFTYFCCCLLFWNYLSPLIFIYFLLASQFYTSDTYFWIRFNYLMIWLFSSSNLF